ncbi:hypothetical protein I317_07867 [Kwoniella heveanensis CBS 569]|uniref:Uncharacterized protein n=1 Tax=Kwoniella heveanensis BCC8398 TaxID=1296120 RepID=A0A1B9GKZ2_9TREE|nr:hypothetical protein I316_06638 [Kwoniella heveanensis BCC8398]OCF38371.1 hypothetical protein I317_07867 [Kwoniella heveanensis CBS 569]
MYRVHSFPALSLLVGLSTFLLSFVRADVEFYFQWPNVTTQCQEVPLTWGTGEPPFTLWIIPVYGQPFIYPLSDSYYSNGAGSIEILLQLAADVSYVAMMSDARGIATGGSSEIQTVQASNDSSCLSWAGSQSVSLDFTFTVSGQAVQCQRGFETSWTGGLEYGPYNFTVIAMDQSFNAYDVTLEDGVKSQSDWVMDVPAGSRFTIMMNSAEGYGRGGTAGIYESQPSNDTDCLDFKPQPTGVWPSTITIATMDAATLPVTESAHPPGEGGKVSGGAIAGIVVGIVVLLAIIGLALFFLLKRRKRRAATRAKMASTGVDLADDGSYGGRGSRNNSQPMIEPYRQVGSFPAPSAHSAHTPTSEDVSIYNPGAAASSTTALTSGNGTGLPHTSILTTQGHETGGPHSPLSADESGPSVGPGVAGPLPSKGSLHTPTSSTSHPPSLPYISSPPFQHEQPTAIPRQASPTSAPSSDSMKNATLSSLGPSYPPRAAAAPQGGMRVVNHDSPESIPTLPPGATHGPRRRPPQDNGPTFRRHADAGRYQEEIVDLPPLYSEVPRDNPASRPLSPEEEDEQSHLRY